MWRFFYILQALRWYKQEFNKFNIWEVGFGPFIYCRLLLLVPSCGETQTLSLSTSSLFIFESFLKWRQQCFKVIREENAVLSHESSEKYLPQTAPLTDHGYFLCVPGEDIKEVEYESVDVVVHWCAPKLFFILYNLAAANVKLFWDPETKLWCGSKNIWQAVEIFIKHTFIKDYTPCVQLKLNTR